MVLDGLALAAVVAYQQAAGRREICGMCAIDSDGAQHFLALINHGFDPDRFETSAADAAALDSVVKSHGWRISAFVHTHPCGGLEMSEQDKRSFLRDKIPWIIVAIDGAKVNQRTYG